MVRPLKEEQEALARAQEIEITESAQAQKIELLNSEHD